MKISSKKTRSLSMPIRVPASGSKGKVFSLRTNQQAVVRPQAQAATGKTQTIASAEMKAIASGFRSGKIPSRHEAIQKMVGTMLQRQYGSKLTQAPGYANVQAAISDLIAGDPALSQRMENLLKQLA